MVCPAILKGFHRSVMMALQSTSPRADLTTTRSPLPIPFSLASSLDISTNIWGSSSISQGVHRVMTPVCQCSVTR